MNNITSSPLTWPEGWKRTIRPKNARFKQTTVKQSITKILHELRLMGIPDKDVIISTNLQLQNNGLPYSSQKPPKDTGASVWWVGKNKQQRVIALDSYNKVEHNLSAIGKTLEAMRGINRWGGSEILERTFTGFIALPATTEGSNWRGVFAEYVTIDIVNLDDLEIAYRLARSESHPDKGGSSEEFIKVTEAYDAAKLELKG